MSRGTTLLRGGVFAAGCAVLVATGVVLAEQEPAAPAAVVAEPAAPAEPSGGSADPGGLDVRLSELPQQLVDDLGALRDLPVHEQLPALLVIRDRTSDGEYGELARVALERSPELVHLVPADVREDVEAIVPAGLREDVEAIVPTGLDLGEISRIDTSDPASAFEDVRDGALRGSFGDDVQGWAESVSSFLG